jgi:hypothetical protein
MPEVEAAGLVLESELVGAVGDAGVVGLDGLVGLALFEEDGGGSFGVLGSVVGSVGRVVVGCVVGGRVVVVGSG